MKNTKIWLMLGYLEKYLQSKKNKMLAFGSTGKYIISSLRDSLVGIIWSKYDSIDNLPIINFQKVLETKQYQYLFRKRVRKSRSNYRNLEKVWLNIVREYEAETKTNLTSLIFRKIKQIKAQEYNLELLKTVYNLKISGCENANQLLENLGCTKKGEKEVYGFIILNETKLALLVSEYQDLTKESDNKVDFYLDVAKVEKALGRFLELEKISVKRWISIIKEINNSHVGEDRNNRKRGIQSA